MKQNRGFVPVLFLVLIAVVALGYLEYKYFQNNIPDGLTFPVEWNYPSPAPEAKHFALGGCDWI